MNNSGDHLPLLEAIGIGRQVAADGRWLLREIDVTLNGGDRVALIGPSGAGKSILLRLLAMLDPHDAGEIRWRGQPVHGSNVPVYRRHVMYMHQRPPLLEGTVEENLRYPFQLRVHHERQFDAKRIEDWLKQLGRDATFLAKRQSDLSGGEGQIVALLRAVQLDPEILLLDEPTAALDRATSAAVERLVQLWYDELPQGRATVWVSHDLDQAVRCSNQEWKIDHGKLVGA